MGCVALLGVATVDFMFFVDVFPATAEKYRASDAAIVGGGCAANAAVAVARLGGRAQLQARLGSDAVAAMIAADLDAAGVDTSRIHRAEGGRSAFSSVLVDAAGERQIVNFRGSGLTDDTGWISLPDDAAAALTDTRWAPGMTRLLDLARARGIPGIVDAEAPFDAADLARASHVTFSAQGLRTIHPDGPLDAALAAYRQGFDGWACVTDGARGVWYDGPAGRGHVAAFRVDAVDTLGAGDIWHGAFALRLAEGAGEVDAIRFANAAAALKCTRRGGRDGTPTRAETEDFLKGDAP